jgi:hypothetical protein
MCLRSIVRLQDQYMGTRLVQLEITIFCWLSQLESLSQVCSSAIGSNGPELHNPAGGYG